jgi:thiol:disulfide interchange protein DsbA
MTPAAATAASSAGKVEIIEFFQYGCPHCYTMEPHMVLWKRMYKNVATVTRVPVTYRPLLRSLARLYYTLDALGRIDAPARQDAHREVFDRIFRDGSKVMAENEAENFKLQQQFATTIGIDAEEFDKVYHSAAVEQKVRRAVDLGTQYKIASTPMFIVGGKYKTDIREAGDEYRLMYLLTDLALMARDERQRALTSR